MLMWQKPLKIGKTDRYSLDVSNWLDGQSLTSFNVTALTGVTVSNVVNQNGKISCLILATAVGEIDIEFSYSTVDRNDCQIVKLNIIEDC